MVAPQGTVRAAELLSSTLIELLRACPAPRLRELLDQDGTPGWRLHDAAVVWSESPPMSATASWCCLKPSRSPCPKLRGWSLFELGWGESWFTLCLVPSDVTLQHLRRHLRTLLRVRDEAGRWLMFRFYGPRVLGRSHADFRIHMARSSEPVRSGRMEETAGRRTSRGKPRIAPALMRAQIVFGGRRSCWPEPWRPLR